jgi:phosphatidylserine decarboxylase
MKIAREGYPFIFTAGILALLVLVIGWKWLGLVLVIVTLAFLGFFRDPDRIPPQGDGLILSPADGKLVRVKPLEAGGTQVSIFLSPLDVHVNRAPIGGRVEDVRYQKGSFVAAYKDEASLANEQNSLTIVDPQGRSLRLIQIAGVVARRIVCYARKGDALEAGQRLGLIMFGSRVDLFLPSASVVQVAEGQRVKGAETVLGRFS